MALEDKERGEDSEGDRDDEGLERRCGHFKAFDCGKHGNRRRDDAVAIEKGRAEQAEQEHADTEHTALEMAQDECHQGHDATFTFVVGAENHPCILDGNDECQRPEDDRQNAKDVVVRDRYRVVGTGEHFLHRVKRAGTNVAIDHPQRCER